MSRLTLGAAAGPLCGLTRTAGTDPAQVAAEIHGGPLAGYDAADPAAVAEVYVFCSVQVGGTGLASDPDAVVADAEGIDSAYLAPTPVSFAAAAETFLCTEIWIATSEGHISIYYDAPGDVWTSSPGGARCAKAIEITVPPIVH